MRKLPALLLAAAAGTLFAAEYPNYALNCETQASSLEQSKFGGELAVDGIAATRWSSARTDSEWLTLDLGEVRRVGRIVLNWERSAPLWYAVQLSTDDEHYTDVFEETEGAMGAFDIVDIRPQEARYVRIDCRERTTEYGFSLFEAEVYPPVKNLTYRSKAWASSSLMPDGAPEYATDGSQRTGWRAPGGRAQWIQFNLGKLRHIGRLKIDWGGGAPKSYTVQFSEDGRKYIDMYTAADQPQRSEETVKIDRPRRARYIRLNLKEAAGESYGIREFEALPR
ncbi:MAG: discoidin domain-containing protein [Lentisphaeria bacterium]|nr:discoidin domain-containing protein [Lentisphaeria bacterium]